MILTLKQWRIVQLVTEGMDNKEIAHKVGNTEHTLKNYLRVIYDETGMNNRLELAIWYLSKGEAIFYGLDKRDAVKRCAAAAGG